jgi:MAE_28990/MAE_18760-like HEPN
MNLVQLRAELEADQAWRRDEIRFFQNQTARLNAEEQQNPFRRVLILLLYAHFEGSSRFALTLYNSSCSLQGA